MAAKKPSRLWEFLLFLLITASLALSGFALFQHNRSTIQQDYVVIHPTSEATTPLSDILIQGQSYALVSQKGEWSYIAYGDKTGWVQTIELQGNPSQVNHPNRTMVQATKANVGVYKDFRETDKEIGKLDENTSYPLYYERNSWAQIIYNNQLVWVEATSIYKAKEQN